MEFNAVKTYIVCTVLVLLEINVQGKGLSPYQYGLAEAKTGEERYWAIYRTHADAVKQNTTVDYSGIKQLNIEIPENARRIPLCEQTDFSGLKLTVSNTKRRDFTLFYYEKTVTEIDVDKECFTTYSFEAYPELRTGCVLLIVEDKNPWVENRIGFNYGATRRDVLLLRNGKAVNKTISPYDNEYSSPRCYFIKTSENRKFFKNIEFDRDESSTMKTFLLNVKNLNNLEISGITVKTPNRDDWYADAIITVEGCTNLSMCDIKIENTYSQKNQFGYAFALGNIWNATISKVTAVAEWGVFGCSNINKATLTDCYINRFDLHCYGKDYYFRNCTILDEIPISSMFVEMKFEKCTFETAYPCEYRYDYNAYTPFNLIFNRCTFKMDKKHNFIVFISKLSDERNSRKELHLKCLPNICIKKSVIELDEDVDKLDIIHVGENLYKSSLGYITSIEIRDLTLRGAETNVNLVTNNVETLFPVNVTIKRFKYKGRATPSLKINLNYYNPANTRLKASRLNFKIDEE